MYALSGEGLTVPEREALAGEPWGVSAIVLWEIEMLFARGRIRYGLDHPLVVGAIRQIEVWPLTSEVCLRLRELDRADELIAATSLAHNVPLVTRDARIRASETAALHEHESLRYPYHTA